MTILRGLTCVSAKSSTRSIHSGGESGPGRRPVPRDDLQLLGVLVRARPALAARVDGPRVLLDHGPGRPRGLEGAAQTPALTRLPETDDGVIGRARHASGDSPSQ